MFEELWKHVVFYAALWLSRSSNSLERVDSWWDVIVLFFFSHYGDSITSCTSFILFSFVLDYWSSLFAVVFYISLKFMFHINVLFGRAHIKLKPFLSEKFHRSWLISNKHWKFYSLYNCIIHSSNMPVEIPFNLF